MPRIKKDLSEKQEQFVAEYLISLQASDAAHKAGYSYPAQSAGKLMANPLIQLKIAAGRRKAMELAGITRENVLQELAFAVFRDPADLCDENGDINLSDLRKLPPAVRRCIDSLEITGYYEDDEGVARPKVKLKFVGKLGAMELLMKHFGMLEGKGDGDKPQNVFNLINLYRPDPSHRAMIEDQINNPAKYIDVTPSDEDE